MIKSLNLSMNGLSTNGALAVGDMLTQNDSLTYLNISYNRIFDQGCAYLAKGLEKNETLHHLIVSRDVSCCVKLLNEHIVAAARQPHHSVGLSHSSHVAPEKSEHRDLEAGHARACADAIAP